MAELPSNLNQWPQDPFDVLGVKPDTDSRTIRRAYFKLIRRFTPDDEPEKFQRIRECYEMIESGMAGIYHSMRAHADTDIDIDTETENQDSDDNQEDDVESESESQPDSSVSTSNLPPVEDDVPFPKTTEFEYSIWDAINDQQFDQARRMLELKFEEHRFSNKPVDARHRVLHYYICWLTDDLTVPEPTWQRILQLTELLEDHSYLYIANQRLEEEFQRHAENLTGDRFEQLLARDKDGSNYDTYFRARWRHLSGTNQTATILDDVAKLESEAMKIGETRLLNLMFESIEFVIWNPNPAALDHYKKCYDLACQQIGVGAEYEIADAMEYSMEAAREWKKLSHQNLGYIGKLAVEIIPHVRTDSRKSHQDRWLKELVKLDYPHEVTMILDRLDGLFESYPLAMSLFQQATSQVVDEFLYDVMHEYTEDEIEDLVISLFEFDGTPDYERMRRQILRFCIENAISLYYFARVADELVMQPGSDEVGWYAAISQDHSLNCAYSLCMMLL